MSNNYNNKSVVTIMDRQYVGEDDKGNARYIYYCSHVAVGFIDQKDEVFVDRNGNEYFKITDADITESPHAYANATTLAELKKMANADLEDGEEISLTDSIKLYEYTCKQLVYFASKTKDGHPFCMAFNMDKIQESVEVFKESVETEEKLEDLEDSYIASYEDELDELIKDVASGKYNLDELEDISEQLNNLFDDIMDASETIGMVIESIKNKTTYSEQARKNQKQKETKNKKTTKEEKKEKELIEVEVEEESRININDLYEKVTKTLIAQDEPTRRVIVELARKELDDRKKKEGILLAGPTGVGKTKMMELIAEYVDRPFLKVDTTQLTVPGYVGKDIEEVLWDLFIKCGRDLKKAERAIIYFDEIDKKGSSEKSDVSGQGVLNVLLPFIEGSTYDAYPDSKRTEQKVKINTTNMTIILGGAFTDVYKNLHITNQIGFDSEKESIEHLRDAEPKDFVEYGKMTNEFMGRVVVIPLNDLSLDDLQRVLIESDQSALRIQEEIFNQLGVKIKFTDDYIKAVCEKAYKKKTGARGLAGIVDESTWKAFDEVSCNEGIYRQVTFTEQSVEDNKQYKLVKKNKK